MVNDLAGRGVGFRSLHESIDTTTPAGKLVFHVFAARAEFERDLIQERTRGDSPPPERGAATAAGPLPCRPFKSRWPERRSRTPRARSQKSPERSESRGRPSTATRRR